MVQLSEFAAIRTQVLTDNTAQSVLNHLRELEDNRAHVRTRWVWELLQNARDAAVKSDGRLVASIAQDENEIVFSHNGDNFKMAEIAHLIYHGSTKVESAETIGQYGSGFLTTHLLSPEIEVSGRLEDGRSFSFPLKRELGSVSELSASMRNAEVAFVSSLSNAAATDDFPTKFRYPRQEGVRDVVAEGIAKLKQCAPLIVAFNRQFAAINIATPSGVVVFDVVDRKVLQQSGIEQIAVSETTNGNKRMIRYLVAHGDKLSVAVPVETTDDGLECRQIENTPRLFLGFPLIGTENFSFPAIINSFRFTPTENRDGVYLWQAEGSNANLENQAVLEEACGLLVGMLQYVVASGWRNAYRLAEIPDLQRQNWLDGDKLRDFLKESLIERIRQIPAVLNESGQAILPKESEIPLADTAEGVAGLWDLLVEWQDDGDIWPRRDESAGWCDAVKSWAALLDRDPGSFDETTDGRKLASRVDTVSHAPLSNPRTHRVSLLADSLKGNRPTINWLDQLITFLRANGQGDAVSEHRIVPSQEGFLRTSPKLHRDVGISEELKTVAGLLEWRIKAELRDTRITSLAEKPGAGDWDNAHVLKALTEKLKERADKNPDADFAEASVRLFSWIAGRENWDSLLDFPVFSEEPDAARRRVIKLDRAAAEEVRPFAPVPSWEKDLQPFEELFPRRFILSEDFFKSSQDLEIWRTLEDRGFIRRDPIIRREVHFDIFRPDQPLPDNDTEHKTAERVTVTDVAFLTRGGIGMMARVRESQRLARVFWRFLTEWLIVRDPDGMEVNEADCDCKGSHRYYPAEWLEPVVENKWVPVGERRADWVTAKSLAILFRSGGWAVSSLVENREIANFLQIVGIRPSELAFETVATDDNARAALENTVTRMLVSAGENIKHLDHARQFIEDLKSDEGLPGVLEERRKQRQRVHENQHLGEVVEDLVKGSLQEAGFKVCRTGKGSDFEIEPASTETDDVASLELERAGQTWLVEVKSTR